MNGLFQTAQELLIVTLFSLYASVAYSLWMPLLSRMSKFPHMPAQFLLIALPQASIILLPQYKGLFYLIFGIFGGVGGLLSWFR